MAYFNGKNIAFSTMLNRVGASNYSKLENKPSINNIVLEGNKSLKDLGILNTFFITNEEEFLELNDKIDSGDTSIYPFAIFILTDLEEFEVLANTLIVSYIDENGEEFGFYYEPPQGREFTEEDKMNLINASSFVDNYNKYSKMFGILYQNNDRVKVYDMLDCGGHKDTLSRINANHFIFNIQAEAGTGTLNIYYNKSVANASMTNQFDISALSEGEAVSGTIDISVAFYTNNSQPVMAIFAKATFRNSKGELNLYDEDTLNIGMASIRNITFDDAITVLSAYGKVD